MLQKSKTAAEVDDERTWTYLPSALSGRKISEVGMLEDILDEKTVHTSSECLSDDGEGEGERNR
jgi:hypothetical protein